MQIKTKYFGEIAIDEEMIVEFPWGVLGFPESKQFILLEMPELEGFKFLQDVHNSYVAFMMVSPWEFFPDYQVDINEEELMSIRTQVSGDPTYEVHVIVTVGNDMEESTANLMAPIVINPEDRIGRQFVLHDSTYGTRHLLIPQGIGA